ncbi:MAG: hypothetical protein CMH13_03080 [Martelella sp.]|nr:hypothetical protein [Martelella sp.]|tara:strand:+ start:329 stop:517 length:189 start_codon:yes stop_codon:yes gene_type:complete
MVVSFIAFTIPAGRYSQHSGGAFAVRLKCIADVSLGIGVPHFCDADGSNQTGSDPRFRNDML